MKQFEYMTPETVVKSYEDAKTWFSFTAGLSVSKNSQALSTPILTS